MIKEIKQELLNEHQVRKTWKQKSNFIEYVKAKMREEGKEVKIESSGKVIKSRNIIIGDVDNANYIFTAHYDTCAWSPFSNRIWLKNPIMYLVYQCFVTFFLSLIGFAISLLFSLCTKNIIYTIYVFDAALILIALQLLFGFHNPHTANDNTSGVLTLLAAVAIIPKEELDKVAFVLFDNEEKGLFGSRAFRKKHRGNDINCLINFDCVGEGNSVFLIHKRSAKEKCKAVKKLIPKNENYNCFDMPGNAFCFASDHVHFKHGIGVAMAKKSKLGGYTVGRLHTPRDIRLDEANVALLIEWIRNLSSIV